MKINWVSTCVRNGKQLMAIHSSTHKDKGKEKKRKTKQTVADNIMEDLEPKPINIVEDGRQANKENFIHFLSIYCRN